MNRSGSDRIEWTTSIELIVELDARTEPTKGARLRSALRETIRRGRLAPGDRLPSSRALAADLGVSRGLVVETYEQLVAEGYLVSSHGSGTTVATNAAISTDPPERPAELGRQWLVDFGAGTPDVTAFPRASWASAVRTALRDLTDAELTYRDPRGDEVLRAELAAYLRRVRGAETDADRLFIVSGFTHGLTLVSRALLADGVGHLAVEDPGAYVQRDAMTRTGMSVEPVAVDGDGVRTEQLVHSTAQVVMTTPAHQYPLGGVLTPERRAELLDWAKEADSRLIIEDDYDAEFRYDRSPIGTLHGLAPEHVVLGGSVSKSLAPAMRLGWVAVPDRLAGLMAQLQEVEYTYPSTVDQRALALFLSSGRYDRHIRRTRATYRERRDILLDLLDDIHGLHIGGIAAGLHVSVELPDHVDETALVEDLHGQGIFLLGLSNYRIRPGPPGFVLGYAHLTPEQLRVGAAAIGAAVRRHV